MTKAKIFENGRSQAVRLPKECRFDSTEVNIQKVGKVVMLVPTDDEWAGLDAAIALMDDDFMEDGRDQGLNQERDEL